MHWDQILTVFAVIATNLGTVLTLYINLDKKLDENRKETNSILEAMRKDSQTFQKAISDEIKDFHGRLCAIEEKRK